MGREDILEEVMLQLSSEGRGGLMDKGGSEVLQAEAAALSKARMRSLQTFSVRLQQTVPQL